MPKFTEEELMAARSMTAIEYLKRFEGSRMKKSSAKNEWQLTDHDSFKINERTSAWHWKSRDIGGYSALDFLITVNGMDFQEAVHFLSGQNPSYVPPEQTEKERVPFVLPERAPNCGRIRTYLNQRGISNEVLNYCIKKNLLYESLPYHNAVFVGYDKDHQPKYAFLRGIYDREGKSFKIEQRGSDKNCAFYIPPVKESNRVAIYEAAIDAMAHMSLEGGQADKYRLSLGGISAPKEGEQRKTFKNPPALTTFLKNHPQITEIEICTDNDFAGRWACEHIKKAYEGQYHVVENLPQAEGADYGELAQKAIQPMAKAKKYMRER